MSLSRSPVSFSIYTLSLVLKNILEILKAHRQHYLFTQHGMLQIPLVSKELEDRFSAQITCRYFA